MTLFVNEDGSVPQLVVDTLIASEPWRKGDSEHAMQIVEAAERVLDELCPAEDNDQTV